MIEERKWYVYRHLREDSGIPFYIGVGKKPKRQFPSMEYQRANEMKDRSDFWHNIVRKHGVIVEVMVEDLTAEEAFDKEKFFIKLYGRANRGGGLLCNLTDGGEGNVNYVASEETKRKLREHNLKSFEKQIEEHTTIDPNTGCWLWTGCLNHRGVPAASNNGKSCTAHLEFYKYFKKVEVPKGYFAKRICGCEICVNPDHIELGTYKDRKKADHSTYKHHRQILTEDMVRLIRKDHKVLGLNCKQLAELHKTTQAAVRGVIEYKSWKWVKDE